MILNRSNKNSMKKEKLHKNFGYMFINLIKQTKD